ncbi:MAG: 3-dehydroquinate synthase [Sulfurospirillum sp.]|nr:MAG: 3-dehydroquinate synthase [Sulfurospirillum sp.]
MEVSINFESKKSESYKIYIDTKIDLKIGSKVAIITNPKVAGLHLKTLLNSIKSDELYIITVPDGEEYKTQSTIDLILENLFNHRFNRGSTLIAFGGGVIGDMVGYASAIYQRGVDFIQIPTTLLSQVDASVGGKTGINNRYGKNLIGAFHQPKAVFIQTQFLKTLPKREFSAGVAEIVKMAVMFDRDFFEWLSSHDLNEEENLRYAIARSVEIKADVVAQDEKEKGIRAVLNYGHTFGHVIENETQYKRYLHGEAVAIGMVMANQLAIELGTLSKEEADKIEKLLSSYSLPTKYEISDIDSFYDSFFSDKKASDESISFILPKGIGDFLIRDDIPKESVLKILSFFGDGR